MSMTNERAAQYFEARKAFLAEIDFDGMIAHDMAIAVLRAQQERDNPQPLTAEALRDMVGQWVWIEHLQSACSQKAPGEWLKLKSCEPTRDHPYIDFDSGGLCFYHYGQGWLAYRYKPKEAHT